MELNIDKLSNAVINLTLNDKNNSLEQIKLPDLKSCEIIRSSNWGPIFSFKLKPEFKIQLKHTNGPDWVDAEYIQIESPMSFLDREQTPFFLSFEDIPNKLKYYVFLNNQLKFARLEIKDLTDFSKILVVQDSDSNCSMNTRGTDIQI